MPCVHKCALSVCELPAVCTWLLGCVCVHGKMHKHSCCACEHGGKELRADNVGMGVCTWVCARVLCMQAKVHMHSYCVCEHRCVCVLCEHGCVHVGKCMHTEMHAHAVCEHRGVCTLCELTGLCLRVHAWLCLCICASGCPRRGISHTPRAPLCAPLARVRSSGGSPCTPLTPPRLRREHACGAAKPELPRSPALRRRPL